MSACAEAAECHEADGMHEQLSLHRWLEVYTLTQHPGPTNVLPNVYFAAGL